MDFHSNPVDRERQNFQERAAWNERFVAECLRGLHAARSAEEGLHRLLAYLGESLECDRVYVFEEMDRQHISNTYEWCAPGVSSGIEDLPYLDKKDLFPWYDWLVAGETVVEPDVDALLDTQPLISEILSRQQIRTIILSPLIAEGTVRGLLGADNPPLERMEQIPVLFGVLANFVLGLVNQRDLNKLRLHQTQCLQPPHPARFMGKKLLIVDDSPELRRLNQKVLRPEGYDIRTAASLQEARERIACDRPDVILMDIDLPDGEGLSFYRALRQSAAIPVVFLTARADEQTARACLHAGGNAFLTKPYKLEELRQAVANAVQGQTKITSKDAYERTRTGTDWPHKEEQT